MRLRDLTGQAFGRLTVLKREPSVKGHTMWRCRCTCGAETIVGGSSLRTGNTASCGCIWRERMTKHGRARSREWYAWKGAKRRCFNPQFSEFHNYGGRGVTMAPEWVNDFAAFFAHVGECPEGMTLDRIDNNGNYEPGNVRWATPRQQANNRRTNRRVQAFGLNLTVGQVARAMEIDWKTAKRLYDKA